MAARFLLAARGHNQDFISYVSISDIRVAGQNVYWETSRYNYGPAWFLILEGFRHIANLADSWQWIFRLEIAILLSLADLGIAALVAWRYGIARGIAFFLVPVSVLISGYHGQFDNVAILFGLGGAVAWERQRGERPLSAVRLTGALLIGLSLITKHILFLLPVWLAIREQDRAHRAVILAVPYCLFGASFLPFLGAGGLHGVIQHVILYESADNAPLWTPLGLAGLTIPLLVLCLLAAGVKTRHLDVVDATGVYLLVLVLASPAVVNQTLAIPLILIVARSNAFTYAYIGVSTLLLLGHVDGLGLQWSAHLFPFSLNEPVQHAWYVYFPSVVTLALAGGWAWWDADRETRATSNARVSTPTPNDDIGNPAHPGSEARPNPPTRRVPPPD